MLKLVLAATTLALLAGTPAGAATKQNCAPIRFTISTSRPIALSEGCDGTIIVNVRIDGKIPYDGQGFGKGNAGLIEYGYGASIRLYQGGPNKATLWVRATTSAPNAQRIQIKLTPQTSTY